MGSFHSWDNFMLLLWKNWVIHKRQKCHVFAVIMSPLAFVLILIVLRCALPEKEKPGIHFPSFNIDDLTFFKNATQIGIYSKLKRTYPKFILLYSPTNEFYDQIVERTTQKLLLDGYESYSNADELELALLDGNYLAGIEFPDSTADIKSYPHKLSFALRFPSELRTTKGKIIKTWMTNNIFPYVDVYGPRNPQDIDGGIPSGYIVEGFAPIQQAVTRAYLELASSQTELPELLMKRFPYGAYTLDVLMIGLQPLLSFFLLLGYVYPSIFMAKVITREKGEHLSQIMKIMGVSDCSIWWSWFVTSFVLLLIIAGLLTFFLKIPVSGRSAILSYSSWSVIFFFLGIYAAALSAFILMLSSFFTQPNKAAAFTGILCVTTNVPFLIPSYEYMRHPVWRKLFSCLFSNTALDFGFRIFLDAERIGAGVDWSNIWSPITVYENLALVYVWMTMLLSTVIYALVSMYVLQISPRKYGVPRKWYFPLQHLNCWKCCKLRPQRSTERQFAGREFDKHLFYRQQVAYGEGSVGIRIRDVSAKCRKQMVLKDLSFDLHIGEITAFLGRNRSGKTSTTLLLAGILKPIQGSIYSTLTKSSTSNISSTIGICPQENILFGEMTVRDHIVFFSCIKGKRDKKFIENEVEKYLGLLNLLAQPNIAASKLPGGMRRKLSLCCALCGDAKLVLCDEPTTGVDPISKMRVWDLLKREKKGRIIVMTTSIIKEADAVADRIGIMGNGELQCFGQPYYLKQLYAPGIRLILRKQPMCNEAAVTAFIRQYIPDVVQESFMTYKFTYYVPPGYLQKSIEMLNTLQTNATELMVQIRAIQSGTLKEVFATVTSERGANERSSAETVTQMDFFNDIVIERKGYKLYCLRIWAMLFKKAMLAHRNTSLIIIQIAFPLVFLTIAILNIRNVIEHAPLRPLLLDISQYDKSAVLLQISNDIVPGSLEEKIENEFVSYAKSFPAMQHVQYTEDIYEHILNITTKCCASVNAVLVTAVNIAPNQLTIWFNNKPLHSVPASLSLMDTAMARALIGSDAEIQVTNKPLPYHPNTIKETFDTDYWTDGIEVSLCFCLCFMGAFFGMQAINERESRAKLLQYVSGVNVCTYWLMTFIFDYFIFSMAALLIIITIALLNMYVYSPIEGLMDQMMILLVFGLVVLPRTYLISLMFRDSDTGFSSILIYNFVSGMAFYVALGIYSAAIGKEHSSVVWILRVFLYFAVMFGLDTASKNENDYVHRGDPEAKSGKPSLPIAEMLVVGGISCILLILIHFGFFKWLRKVFKNLVEKIFKNSPERISGGSYIDEDVIDEKVFIKKMTSAQRVNVPLVVDELTKNYGSFMAVNNVSFRVNNAEIFVLLGVNGMGKTSILKALVGDEKITSGKVYVNGLNFVLNKSKAYKIIGYCPQEDALFKSLTGAEMLYVHGLLRGIRHHELLKVIRKLTKLLDFSQVLGSNISSYTREYCRKLSIAIALIGNPPILYLDEPTSGLDHNNQMRVWQVLSHMRDMGKSILLATNNLHEVETLCTQLGILINNEIVCLGEPNYLLKKFTDGLILYIRLVRQSSLDSYNASWRRANRDIHDRLPHVYRLNNNETLTIYEATDRPDSQTRNLSPINIKNFIESEFLSATLTTEFLNLLIYKIPTSAKVECSDVYRIMQNNRTRLQIEDFQVTHCTTERILMHFSKLAAIDSSTDLVPRWTLPPISSDLFKAV